MGSAEEEVVSDNDLKRVLETVWEWGLLTRQGDDRELCPICVIVACSPWLSTPEQSVPLSGMTIQPNSIHPAP